MGLTIDQGNQSAFELVPEGTYVARCIKLIDLGTQKVEWQGQSKEQMKVYVCWELLDDSVKMEDGRPFATSRTYTASLNEKAALRRDLEAWRGKRFSDEELKGFELRNILGTYCMVQIVHTEKDGNTYANVNAIMSTREKPKAVNPEVVFDLSSYDDEVFGSLPDWMKEKIALSPEYQAIMQVRGTKAGAKTDAEIAKEADDALEDPIDLSEIPF